MRKKIHNRLLEIQGNIRVLCRVRPILEVERRSGEDVDVTEVPTDEELFVQRDQQVRNIILLCLFIVELFILIYQIPLYLVIFLIHYTIYFLLYYFYYCEVTQTKHINTFGFLLVSHSLRV